jgi:hypothetical protein
MQRTIVALLAVLLASPVAYAQSNSNSGAGVAGKPGSKSGPATTNSGTGSANGSTSTDQSKVKGLPGNKSGPAAKAPAPKN